MEGIYNVNYETYYETYYNREYTVIKGKNKVDMLM